MLAPVNGTTAAPPALLVGAAVLAALVALLGGVALSGSSRRRGPAPADDPPDALRSSSRDPWSRDSARHDDLPGFLAAPPGTPLRAASSSTGSSAPAPPGATARGTTAPGGTAPGRTSRRTTAPGAGGEPARRPAAGAHRRRTARLLAGAAVAVLVLAAVVAAVVQGTHGTVAGQPSSAASTSSSRATPASASPLPAQPAQPSPGDPGAGELAGTDLPLGPGDVSARLAAAGLPLAQAPAGVTAGFPRISLTTSGDRAVAHLELPTANCLTPSAPDRPEDGGCQPTATEFADLATPSLQVTRGGGRLTVSGRFPTYLRPAGAPPGWTGRSLDVTVTIDLPAPSGAASTPGSGSVGVDAATAPTLPDPGLTTVSYGR
jgi:hypothetical protein